MPVLSQPFSFLLRVEHHADLFGLGLNFWLALLHIYHGFLNALDKSAAVEASYKAIQSIVDELKVGAVTYKIITHSSVHAKTEVIGDLSFKRLPLYFCLLTMIGLHYTSTLLVLDLDFPNVEILNFGESDLVHELLYLCEVPIKQFVLSPP